MSSGRVVVLFSGFVVGRCGDVRQRCRLRNFACQHRFGIGVCQNLADIAAFEKFSAFDAFDGNNEFFTGFGVVEVTSGVVAACKAAWMSFDADLFYVCTRVPRLVKNTSGFYISQFGADKGRSLARFDVEKFYNEKICAVDVETHAVFKSLLNSHCKALRGRVMLPK